MVLHDDLPDEMLETFGEDRGEVDLIRRTRPSSVMVVPLKARGTVLGALSMWILDPSRAHDTRAQNVALRLAHRAALALDNARLHEQQAHIAQVLQDALRPRSLPEIGGFESASRFLAAGGDAYEVGGDFYDAFDTGSGTWTVVIGDVCGKGPEAAALTALARYTIRTASTPESSPSEVLRTLDESIAGDRAELRFCTAALARVNSVSNGRDSAGLTVALGGHPPPLALRRDGRVDVIGKPGTLLGALPSPAVADVDASLAPSESIVFYTDGLLESRDRSQGRRSRLAGLAAQRRQRRQRRGARRPARSGSRSSARAASRATTSRSWCCSEPADGLGAAASACASCRPACARACRRGWGGSSASPPRAAAAAQRPRRRS